MLESDLQIQLIKAIKQQYGDDAWVFKTHDQCRVGIPDLLICFYGHFVAIELKRPMLGRNGSRQYRAATPATQWHTNETKDKQNWTDVTEMQKYNIIKINRAGGSAFAGRYFNEIMLRLEKIFQSLHLIGEAHIKQGVPAKKPNGRPPVTI
ncbi:MAG: hypothetical protein WC750_05945 [Patescibacteria group bacterium]|jgi:hypothetical protein